MMISFFADIEFFSVCVSTQCKHALHLYNFHTVCREEEFVKAVWGGRDRQKWSRTQAV